MRDISAQHGCAVQILFKPFQPTTTARDPDTRRPSGAPREKEHDVQSRDPDFAPLTANGVHRSRRVQDGWATCPTPPNSETVRSPPSSSGRQSPARTTSAPPGPTRYSVTTRTRSRPGRAVDQGRRRPARRTDEHRPVACEDQDPAAGADGRRDIDRGDWVKQALPGRRWSRPPRHPRRCPGRSGRRAAARTSRFDRTSVAGRSPASRPPSARWSTAGPDAALSGRPGVRAGVRRADGRKRPARTPHEFTRINRAPTRRLPAQPRALYRYTIRAQAVTTAFTKAVVVC
ncbi:hypothetical protein SAMN05421505_10187 [Sinosporangium album]|uniref:Uncharacterized protein n=1 Tax=Sinosporangium album TaxID=504805 RepID=A0A1G7QR15_9ACTN|nr:hypothetical protein SAMN05421505_10187 [Sinosporangium album]